MAMAMAMAGADMELAGSGAAVGAAVENEPSRQWAEMLPEALARIFALLPLEERMAKVPLVCKAWRRAAADPACWRAVDLSEWSRLMQWELIHRMVECVVERSSGQIQELSVCRLMSDGPIDYVSSRGHALKVLRIPFCQISDSCILNLAPSLTSVSHLDISGCQQITKLALARIGQCCKLLVRLDRNMSFFNSSSNLQPEDYDDEAMAIAKNMPLLKHLELCYGSLSNKGLLAILDSCKQLEFLDLRGCVNLDIEGSVAERCRKLRVVYNHKFSEQYEDFMSDFASDDLPDDVFSDFGWGWYSDMEIDGSESEEGPECFPYPADIW